jgi:hypothetical protein
MATGVALISPYPHIASEYLGAGSSYMGGEPDILLWDSSVATQRMRWELGRYIPFIIDGNGVTVDKVIMYFYSSAASPTANLLFQSYDSDRINNPNAGTSHTTETGEITLTSIGTNTYKAEVSPAHTITDNTHNYWIRVISSFNNVNFKFMGGEIQYTYTVPTLPYQLDIPFWTGPDRADANWTGAGTSWGGLAGRYTTIGQTNNLIAWDLGKYVHHQINGKSVRIDDVRIWWWNPSGQDGTFWLRGYDADRINNQSGSAVSEFTTTTWTSLGVNTYRMTLTPSHTLVNGRVYTIGFDGKTTFGSSPRIQGGRILATVLA